MTRGEIEIRCLVYYYVCYRTARAKPNALSELIESKVVDRRDSDVRNTNPQIVMHSV